MNNYDKSIQVLKHHARYGGYHISDENNIMIQNDLERAKKVEEELEEYKISDKSKEESSIEYYNLYKETKRKLKKVEELLGLYRDMRSNTGYKHLPEVILEKIKLKEKELEAIK